MHTCAHLIQACACVHTRVHPFSEDDADILLSEELHAEVCYAECLLQRAALTFLQVSVSRLYCSASFWFIGTFIIYIYIY